jgi:molecular chaperone DnaK
MGSKTELNIDHRTFSPEQISALILQKLRKQAQDYLGHKVTKAIITVPAYFDDSQRLATRDAGQIAGLEVVRIINEPTACALSYGLHRLKQESTLIIFDFGGGTFDVTILQLAEQVLHVKATSGNNRLGGDDFDQRIIDWINEGFRKEHGIDLTLNAEAMQRLKEAAEAAKIELSGRSATHIELPFLAYSDGNPLHFSSALSAEEFNSLTADLVAAVANPILTALEDAKLAVDDIDQVILVGGTTRVPAVQQFIRGFFNQEPVKSVNPDEAVALGAAIQGGILTGEIQEVLLLDVVPITIGLELGNGAVNKLFRRNTTIPVSANRTFTTAADAQTTVSGHIVQGEDDRASGNKSLARFDITAIPPAPAGTPQLAVTFSIDVDGILFVEAKDAASGAPKPVLLHRTHGLTREALERLTREEELRAEQERLAEERRAATIMAQSCLQDAERALVKFKDRLASGYEEAVRTAVRNLRDAVANAETDEISALTRRLEALIIQCTRAATSAAAPGDASQAGLV